MTNKRAPKNANARRIWIKSQLELRGHSYSSIARDLGVCRQAPLAALIGRSKRMEREIAIRLGLLPEDIWPERYPDKGNSRRDRRLKQ